MKLSVDEIKNAPDHRLDISFSDYIEELNLKDKACATLILSASNYGINVRGRINADVVRQCDRCLSDYVYNLDTDINEDYVIGKVVPESQKEIELGENDFVEELTNESEIDIKDLIYQSIILELPYKSLCAEDCEGFSVKNESEYIDERLEVFKSFSENRLSNKKEGI